MTTTAKLIHLPTVRRKVNSRKAHETQVALLKEEAAKSLAEVDRLFAADSAQLIEASTVGGDHDRSA